MMHTDSKIEFTGDYIYVYDCGGDDYETTVDLWRRIAAACEEHNCFNILGEGYYTDKRSTMNSFRHVEIFKAVGITWKHRIAWVDHAESDECSSKFIEMVLKNRGLLNGGLFQSVEEARNWLLS